MIRRNQRFIKYIHALSDALIIMLSYILSIHLWLGIVKQDQNMAWIDDLPMVLIALLYVALWVLALAICGLYDTNRTHRIIRKIVIIWVVSIISVVIIAGLLFAFRLEDFSRGVLIVFCLFSAALLSLKHYILYKLLNHLRAKGWNLKHVVIAGTGTLAQQFACDIRTERNFGFNLLGFCGKVSVKEAQPYLGTFASMEDLLQDSRVDEVIIALEPNDVGYTRELIGICEKSGTKISIIPFYNDIIPSRAMIEVIGKSKLINLRGNALDNYGWAFCKRFFDIVISALLLVLLSPLLVVVAMSVKLSSPGPVLFRQKRVGRSKKLFQMLKFRSMHINDAQDTAWTTNNDPRKTKLGSFLRKFSLDELPQLLNVLRGEMSLVGPRPEIPYYVEQYKENVPLYMVKHQVRPGMTGWAQVNGYRGDTSIIKRIEYDIWYIENWSIGLDLKILLMTAAGGMLNKEKLAPNEGKVTHQASIDKETM